MHKLKLDARKRIKQKKIFNEIISKGEKALFKNFFVRWICISSKEGETKIAVTVPKKKYKRATDRNRLKRQTKEAYRLNQRLLEPKGKDVFIIFTYVSSQKTSYQEIEQNIIEILKTIQDKCNNKAPVN